MLANLKLARFANLDIADLGRVLMSPLSPLSPSHNRALPAVWNALGIAVHGNYITKRASFSCSPLSLAACIHHASALQRTAYARLQD